ncbi:GNVR domain-containing protein [Moritella sp. Urea-trap-13]|uniref:GumC family protein n=1 Tax=Moritella sp. Urea-trap-13 TaxID=2058327 RepID=UPI000C341EAB|nr:GNVR domain-containing protein [Moritella sp. Urea-trap-13]PKH09607.1 polysaccharide export protein [Moritella sp. Urea-trap-13]
MNAWAWLYRCYGILWRKRIYLLLPVLIMPIIGYQVGRSIPESYYSHTTILLQESSVLNPILAELSLPLNVQSRFKSINILVKRKQILLNAATQAGLIKLDDTEQQQQSIINLIKQSLTLSLSGTDLITISLKWPDPTQLTIILNIISEQFILRLTKPNQDIALNSKLFLAQQVNQQHTLLQEAEQALFSYQFEHARIIPELYQAREATLMSINKQLKNKSQTLTSLQSKLSTLTKKLILTNPAAQYLDNKITQLETVKTQQLAYYTTAHSKIKAINLQIKNLLQQRRSLQTAIQDQQSLELLLNRMTRLTKSALTTQVTPLLLHQLDEYEGYKSAIIKTKIELKKLKQQQVYFHQNQTKHVIIEQQLLQLKRDLSNKNTLYLDLLTRHEMVAIRYDLGEFEATTNVQIITPPFVPEQAINLPIFLYVLLGLLLGLIQGIAISFTLSITQDTLWDERNIAYVTGLRTIARIPLIPSASGR